MNSTMLTDVPKPGETENRKYRYFWQSIQNCEGNGKQTFYIEPA